MSPRIGFSSALFCLLVIACISAGGLAIRSSQAYPTPATYTWLQAPIRIVEPSAERAETLAQWFTEAGFGVEIYPPETLDQKVTPGFWWITNAAAQMISAGQIRDLALNGSKILLDGLSPPSISLFQLRVLQDQSVRRGRMSNTELRWDTDITLAIPQVQGSSLATTERNTPALFRSGNLIWSLPKLSEGMGLQRLPYLPQALRDAWGLEPRAERHDLDVYVDPDLEGKTTPTELATRWRTAGVRRVYVAGWKRDRIQGWRYDYPSLVAAAHKQDIQVFSWLEWPHIDFSFWKEHPECQEITASGKPAKIFWREHIAILSPVCFEKAWLATKELLQLANFDGVNVAELYFESVLRGPENLDEYTPFHPWVRQDYKSRFGFDPTNIFNEQSSYYWQKHPENLQKWEGYRLDMVTKMHFLLLEKLKNIGFTKNVVVTLIDERYDEKIGSVIRRNIGMDTRKIIDLRKNFPFEVQIEDSFLFWSAMPERYEVFPDLYREVEPNKLILDINIVDRGDWLEFQRITKKAIGLELYKSISAVGHQGSSLALYASSTIPPMDFAWVKFALAGRSVKLTEHSNIINTNSQASFWLRLARPAKRWLLDGAYQSDFNSKLILVPVGIHTLIFE